MRPGQQNKRGRGRGSNNNGGGNNNNFNRKGGNPLTRTYDSSGPDVKIRGTAQHIAEKYAQLARDAQSSGDRVIAENYLQHAEHYNRIIATAQAQMQERYPQNDRNDAHDSRDQHDRESDDMDALDGDEQPVIVSPPRHQNNYRDNNNQQRDNNRDRQRDQSEQRQRQSEDRSSGAVEAGEAHLNGSGPQPSIPTTPAEVALNSDNEAGNIRKERQPRRPRAPRAVEGSDFAASPVIEPAPSDAVSSAEEDAPKKPARPRRQPRRRLNAEGGEGESAASEAEGDAPALAAASSE